MPQEEFRLSLSSYQKAWQDYNNQIIPKGYHIHHLDGNRKNNDPENLICVSPQLHYEIHCVLWEKYGRKKDLAAAIFLKKEVDNPKKLPSPNKGKKLSEDQIRAISEKMKGKTPWNKGKSPSEEYRKKISIANSGKKWTKEHKENFIKSRTGAKTNKAKPFFFYGKEYRTLTDCKKDIGRSITFIYKKIKDESNKECHYSQEICTNGTG